MGLLLIRKDTWPVISDILNTIEDSCPAIMRSEYKTINLMDLLIEYMS